MDGLSQGTATLCKVFVSCVALNAEGTINRAVDSVLNQTHKELIFYVAAGAQGDETYRILQNYSYTDNRIHLLQNDADTGAAWSNLKILTDLILQEAASDSECYFCTIDANDEYKPDFIEKTLAFMRENNLDAAACASDCINTRAQTPQASKRLEKDGNLILEGDAIGVRFPHYFQFMKEMWGKVFRLDLLKRCDYKNYNEMKEACDVADTLFSMRAFLKAGRAGILNEALYKNHIHPKSAPLTFDGAFIAAKAILFNETEKWLTEKTGSVSKENKAYNYMLYLTALRDAVDTMLKTQISNAEKLEWMRKMFTNERTIELTAFTFLNPDQSDTRGRFYNLLAEWIILQSEIRKDNTAAADIFAGMNMVPTNLSAFSDADAFKLLCAIRNRPFFKFKGGADIEIGLIISQQPMLKEYDTEFLSYFSDIAAAVINNDLDGALDQIIAIIAEEREVPGEFIPDIVTLGLNLAAKTDQTEYFLFLKKLQVSMLIDEGRAERAALELADYDKLLPHDEDFANLRKLLEGDGPAQTEALTDADSAPTIVVVKNSRGVMKVVILADGLGAYISEDRRFLPKPMVEIGGKPILWHIMKHCSYYGFNEFIICLGYKGYLIKEYFAARYLREFDITFDYSDNGRMIIHDNASEPFKVTLADTGINTQTGGRVKRVSRYIGDNAFLTVYGDSLSDVDLLKLIAAHKNGGNIATLTAMRPAMRFGALDTGVLNIDDKLNRVTGFSIGTGYVNAGFMVLSPSALDYIEGDKTTLEREPLEAMAARGGLGAYKHNGFRRRMDTQADKRQLDDLWRNDEAPWRIWEG